MAIALLARQPNEGAAIPIARRVPMPVILPRHHGVLVSRDPSVFVFAVRSLGLIPKADFQREIGPLFERADTHSGALGSEVRQVVHAIVGAHSPEDVAPQVAGADDAQHATFGVDPVALGMVPRYRQRFDRSSVPDL